MGEVQMRLRSVFDRLRPDLPTMLVFGEPDVRLHLEDMYGTRGEFESDDEAVRRFVCRYMCTVDFIRSRYPQDVIVYNSVPTLRDEHNRLARLYNTYLHEACVERSIPYIDIWDDIVAEGDSLDEHYAAEHIHLNEQIAPLVVGKLIRRGYLPQTTDPESKYVWQFNHTVPINDEFEVRIWGDAELDPNSPRFVRTRGYRKVAKLLQDAINTQRDPILTFLPSTEGFLPLELDKSSYRKGFLFEADPARATATRRLISFSDLNSIQLEEDVQCVDSLPVANHPTIFTGLTDGTEAEERTAVIDTIQPKVALFINEGQRGGLSGLEPQFEYAKEYQISYDDDDNGARGVTVEVAFRERADFDQFKMNRVKTEVTNHVGRAADIVARGVEKIHTHLIRYGNMFS